MEGLRGVAASRPSCLRPKHDSSLHRCQPTPLSRHRQASPLAALGQRRQAAAARSAQPFCRTSTAAAPAAGGSSSSSSRTMVRLRATAPAAEPPATYVGQAEGTEASVEFNNQEDPKCTVITLSGRNETALLMQITGVLSQCNLSVASAVINSSMGGQICDVFRVTKGEGQKIPESEWEPIKQQLLSVLSLTSRSSKPAIFGVTPTNEGEATIKSIATEGDANALEVAAADMANAAAALVGVEREILGMLASSADVNVLAAKQVERAEASALLERRMAAMEAILTSRRALLEAPLPPEQVVPDIFQPAPVKTTGPAAGSGYEIILQAFNWESCKEPWYRKMLNQAKEIADSGFTAVWLPPPTDAVSPQGYLPRDLYDLNCKYGSEAELRDMISVFHDLNIKCIADIVINHRCAHYQGNDGKWNRFGGRLAWDQSVITSNNPAFGGTGGWKQTEDYAAAPNLDHSQERVRKDIIEWMRWLRNSIGFDGWRFDFVKGYDGRYCGEYIDATVPEMAFGEYWDTCSYTDGVLNYNQDAHRQRTINWCDATGATAAAFDFTTKGILQEAVARREYWRLIDSNGKPPGMLGIWPSRAITFLENHDTGSTLRHWPFPWDHLGEGYAYILTHCGTPCVFYDHIYFDQKLRTQVLELVEIRRRFGINYKSEVSIRKAYNELYSAIIDKKIAMKIGPANWSPNDDKVDVGQKEWKLLTSGFNYAVWEAIF